ncbi:MAG: nicotinamide-nucleotide adenylyltransferase [Promethearchaeota archaeon CR_4]|nr:MAG: nicotinamide-nucleotide adenylyltransferase [Candidatus Lokiarchaeota archaeon CR_4]
MITRVYAIHRKTRRYLVQKRGIHRTSNPNKFTDSASGHVDFREHFQFECIAEDAKRELKEEMGVNALALSFWETYFSEIEQELIYCFFAIIDENPVPDTEEVEVNESKSYTEIELKLLLKNAEFIPHVKEQWQRILKGHLLANFLDHWEKCQSPTKNTEMGPGVIIGRFQPFHRGHISLVKEIVRRQGKIIIIIGSKQYSRVQENPFSTEERMRMIRSSLQEYQIPVQSVEILSIEDKHDASKWTEEVCALLPSNADIYSNSEWIRELFHSRGFCLGEILKFNFELYNGTAIRARIFAGQEWQQYVPLGTSQVIQEVIRGGLIDSLLHISPTKSHRN